MLIQTSADFKKKSQSAIFSIILFIIVYILLFIAAIALTLACIAGGIFLIAAKPMFFTVMIGLGMAIFGIMIFYFLIKFLFKKHINDRSYLTEIKQKNEPELFAMINELVKETGTDFPKKVYLSYDVNASVFYDSTFWSMFLPIKKNLTIGIGLVNVCTKQELKAILAHEFGHFSQRSMKVGSYVYNVNQIIFNLVNDDESYRNTIQSWSNASGYFAFFAELALKFTSGIQWILAKMYSFVNIRHLALSREMEFHADEVSANIAGSLALEESLLRLDLADNSYNNVLNFYENKIKENKASKNIYKEQSYVMGFLAKESDLENKNDLPVVKLEEAGLFNKSKLVIENQWASHPSTEDRVIRLRQLNIQKNADNQPAKFLFKNFEETEEKLTTKLFSNVQYDSEKSNLEFDHFKEEFEANYNKDTFDKIFNNYYDNKNPDKFDIENYSPTNENLSFDELFGKEKIEIAYNLIALQNDKSTIEAISKKELDIKTFDYDGTKYKASDAKKLIPTLENEIKSLEKEVTENDINIYHYFLNLSKIQNLESDFRKTYSDFAECDETYENQFQLYVDLSNAFGFVSVTTPFDQIAKNFKNNIPLEAKLKDALKIILKNSLLETEISEESRKDLDYYANNTMLYFSHNEYFDKNLQQLFFAINSYQYYIARNYFLLKKKLLDEMSSLEKNKKHAEVSSF